MAPLESTIDINVDPQHVFAYMTDPIRFPEWQRDVVAVRMADGASGAPGDQFTTTRWIGRSQRTMTQEITEVDVPRRWSARGVNGAIRPHAGVVIQALDGGRRSRVTIRLDFEAVGLAAALLPLVRRQASKLGPLSYRNLKEVLESRTARSRE
jgi:uncharacterized protein YndB with AHSA1/START domain